MTKKQKRAYQREYMRKYYDKNYASLGLHKLGRPPKKISLARRSEHEVTSS